MIFMFNLLALLIACFIASLHHLRRKCGVIMGGYHAIGMAMAYTVLIALVLANVLAGAR